jgi:hypothetical protein
MRAQNIRLSQRWHRQGDELAAAVPTGHCLHWSTCACFFSWVPSALQVPVPPVPTMRAGAQSRRTAACGSSDSACMKLFDQDDPQDDPRHCLPLA